VFASTSRYANVADATYTDASGRQFSFKVLRLTPSAATLMVHQVVQEDRLDLLSAKFYTDPEQFWRICDANVAMRPDDLLQIGQILLIPIVQR
jgi:nucleoid-associated protein YgaU